MLCLLHHTTPLLHAAPTLHLACLLLPLEAPTPQAGLELRVLHPVRAAACLPGPCSSLPSAPLCPAASTFCRPDAKNALYQQAIKQGDLLLNRVQKLSKVIDIE